MNLFFFSFLIENVTVVGNELINIANTRFILGFILLGCKEDI